MWSLGKVFTTPEVKRVYISSFWDREFLNEHNKALFTKEREDLLKEMRELPRNAAIRKVLGEKWLFFQQKKKKKKEKMEKNKDLPSERYWEKLKWD